MTALILPGVIFQRVEDGDLLREQPSIGAAWEAATTRKIGKGYRATVELSAEDRAEVVFYLMDLLKIEEQVAGGAGDPEDVDRSLLSALRKFREREAQAAAADLGVGVGVRVRTPLGQEATVEKLLSDGRWSVKTPEGCGFYPAERLEVLS